MHRLLTLLFIIIAARMCAKPQFKVHYLSSENGLGSNYIRSIVQDPRGYIWMGSTNGLIRYDGYTARLITADSSHGQWQMTDSRILDIRLWQNRYILIRLRAGQYCCYDTETDRFVEFRGNYEEAFAAKNNGHALGSRLTGSQRHAEVTDKAGITWVATYGDGLYAYNGKTGETTHYLAKDNDAPIQTDYLLTIFEDKAGNLWVSQENMGVACISRQPDYIETLFFSSSEQTGHSNSIHLLEKAGGTIYVGNRDNGLKLYDSGLHTFRTADSYHDDIVAVCQDRQGNVWLGSRKSGIYAGQRNYRHNDRDDGSPAKGKVSDIVCDHRGNVWISFFDSGLDLAIPDGQGGYRFRHFFTGNDAIAHPRQMIVDHYGFLWLGSDEGLYIFHPDRITANSKDYRHIIFSEQQPLRNAVHCLTETGTHQVFAGLSGYGLAELDNSKAGEPRLRGICSTADGLPDNNVQQLVEDLQGLLWVGTDHGLAQYHPTKHSVVSLLPAKSPLGNMFVENAACRLDDGRLAFGSRHGITIVDPQQFSLPASPFRPRITGIDIAGTPIHEQGDSTLSARIEQQRELTFGHNQNSLTFYFSDFEYAKGATARFSYRLQGYDSDWSRPSSVNFATYKNLPPGRYTMQVRSLNDGGEWDEETVSQTVIIRPPFWATWWAYLIYIGIIAVIAWTAYRHFRRVNDLRNRIRVEEQLTEYKLQFFTNISHEFRTPLTIIRGAMERIGNIRQLPADMRQPVSSMQKSVDRLLRLINQLLTFSKMHDGKLRLAVEETDVVAFMRDIYSTFREMAEQKRISYQFTTTDQSFLMYVDREFLDKIANNLISNALKYTPAGRSITVAVQIRHGEKGEHEHAGNVMLLRVSDTGVGVPKEKQQELFERFSQSVFAKDSIGIGLHLTNELVRVHHGTIRFEENPGGGSVFTVTLPTDKAVYQEQDFLQPSAITQHPSPNTQALSPIYRELAPEPMNDMRVLIVEDDADVCEFIKGEMGRYFVIDTADNGEEALRRIREQRPDLIISDVMMPIMNGFELTRQIRADRELADLPVILLTALTDEGKQVKGLDCGADAYVTKPFSMQVLLAHCTQLLGQRRKLRTSYAKEVVNKPETPAIIVEEQEKRLRTQLDTWLGNHLSDSDLSIDTFAQKMGYGRTTFYKKVKKLTGHTPNDYIKKLRMERAAELLKDDTKTVAQVAYQIGVDDPYYFSKLFKSYYGISPSQYRKGVPSKA